MNARFLVCLFVFGFFTVACKTTSTTKDPSLKLADPQLKTTLLPLVGFDDLKISFVQDLTFNSKPEFINTTDDKLIQKATLSYSNRKKVNPGDTEDLKAWCHLNIYGKGTPNNTITDGTNFTLENKEGYSLKQDKLISLNLTSSENQELNITCFNVLDKDELRNHLPSLMIVE